MAVFVLLFQTGDLSAQTTGTFIDRALPTDLRVMSYNVHDDSIFPDTSASQAAKFSRVVRALQPDVVNLQEIYSHTSADVAGLLNTLLPLGGSATWYAHQGFDNVIVSRYPLSLQRTNTSPASPRSIAIALVDLPNSNFATDFYFMNNHFKCCGDVGSTEDADRQRQADALVNWMRDARTVGGSVNLPSGTPMAVVGDLNMVGSPSPLNTLLTGNIVNETSFGADSPPDWDGTPLADARPLHNGVGPADYTWRDDASSFDPGRLDFVLYTDSAVSIGKKFVLNTVAMSASDRAAAGLQTYDVTSDDSGITYDHLPLVVDFRSPSPHLPGDYNSDNVVNSSDFNYWRTRFGSADATADGNGNGIVDAADYVVWRNSMAAAAGSSGSAATVPEPASNLLCIALVGTLAFVRRAGRSQNANSC
ncbi:MAG TPA: endonuclease/exonuclease/phosphatase family protein [Lacipirellulaceae bacterium]|nr:endonuclease/exonuclease/phosphatase family protein [Lacipirellulaceae bacterium]